MTRSVRAGVVRSLAVWLSASCFSVACAHSRDVTADFASNVPVLRIDVEGGKAPAKDEKRDADLTLEGDRHRVRIKVRGSSSAYYPKKQFALELGTAGSEREAALLGLPRASSWVLASPYADKTLIKNVLGLAQARQLFPYAPQTRWVELVLNGDYRGVYTLTEKIERGTDKVNVPSVDRGGFILTVDAGDSPYVESDQGTRYTLVYPDEDDGSERSAHTMEWLREWLSAFEASLANENYTRYVHSPSFVDYFLQQELWKNIDAFRKSMYVHRAADRKLHMGPSWDFDLGAAAIHFYGGTEPAGWRHAKLRYAWPSPDYVTWFNELLRHPEFRARVISRWRELREPGALFSDDRIQAMIRENVRVLSQGPASRNFARWKVIGRPLFPVFFFTVFPMYDTWEEEVRRSEQFLLDRASWIDANIESIGRFRSGELTY